jgi:hypothetical protein
VTRKSWYYDTEAKSGLRRLTAQIARNTRYIKHTHVTVEIASALWEAPLAGCRCGPYLARAKFKFFSLMIRPRGLKKIFCCLTCSDDGLESASSRGGPYWAWAKIHFFIRPRGLKKWDNGACALSVCCTYQQICTNCSTRIHINYIY